MCLEVLGVGFIIAVVSSLFGSNGGSSSSSSTAVVLDDPMLRSIRQKDPDFADFLDRMKKHLPDDIKLTPSEQVRVYRRYTEEKAHSYVDSKLKAKFGSDSYANVRIT